MKKKIKIYDLIGEECITPSQGEKLFEIIYPLLESCTMVELDFSGVNVCLSPFFNFSVGMLYEDLGDEVIDRYLTFRGLNTLGLEVLSVVKANASRYFKSNDKTRETIDEIIVSRYNE